MWYIFIIETRERTQPYLVQANTLDEAIQKVHRRLREEQPKLWSPEWEDLREDIVEYGDQTCYGPYSDLPRIT